MLPLTTNASSILTSLSGPTAAAPIVYIIFSIHLSIAVFSIGVRSLAGSAHPLKLVRLLDATSRPFLLGSGPPRRPCGRSLLDQGGVSVPDQARPSLRLLSGSRDPLAAAPPAAT